MNTDPDISTPGSPSRLVLADYAEAQNVLAYKMDRCRYCTAARAKAAQAWDDDKRSAWKDSEGDLRKNGRTREQATAEGGCKDHKERRRLNFTTSPVSETYWAS